MSKLNGKLIFKKYRVKKLISKTSLAWVYEGLNEKDNEPVAMKFEKINTNRFCLESEEFILFNVKGFGIPKIITFGKNKYFSILIEELLGLTLEKLWKTEKIKNNNVIKYICMVALQTLDRLEYIHSKSIIHRDIKHTNLSIGRKNPETLYLIDFGFAQKYRSSRTGKHIKCTNLKKAFGSLNFLSINANKGFQQSRRDDLESLGYMLVFLAKKTLPWINKKISNIKNRPLKYVTVCKLKTSIPLEKLCQGLPLEIAKYIEYCRNLEFEQNPDYNYLRNLFNSILEHNNQKNDLEFYWILNKKTVKEKDEKSEDKRNYFYRRKGSSQQRLYKRIKDSLEKARSQDISNEFRFLRLNSNRKIFPENSINDNEMISNIKTENDIPIKEKPINKNLYRKKVFEHYFNKKGKSSNKKIINNEISYKSNLEENYIDSLDLSFGKKKPKIKSLNQINIYNNNYNNKYLNIKNNVKILTETIEDLPFKQNENMISNNNIKRNIFSNQKKIINYKKIPNKIYTYRTLQERAKIKTINKAKNNDINLNSDKLNKINKTTEFDVRNNKIDNSLKLKEYNSNIYYEKNNDIKFMKSKKDLKYNSNAIRLNIGNNYKMNEINGKNNLKVNFIKNIRKIQNPFIKNNSFKNLYYQSQNQLNIIPFYWTNVNNSDKIHFNNEQRNSLTSPFYILNNKSSKEINRK